MYTTKKNFNNKCVLWKIKLFFLFEHKIKIDTVYAHKTEVQYSGYK